MSQYTPGWYSDPTDPSQQKYFDGQNWVDADKAPLKVDVKTFGWTGGIALITVVLGLFIIVIQLVMGVMSGSAVYLRDDAVFMGVWKIIQWVWVILSFLNVPAGIYGLTRKPHTTGKVIFSLLVLLGGLMFTFITISFAVISIW